MKDIVYTAESWDEFLRDLRDRAVQPAWKGNQASIKGGFEFTRSLNWEKCIELAEQGDKLVTEQVASAAVKVTFEAGPTWEYAPVGAFPCIPAYAAGVPEDMFVPLEDGAANSKPIVRIAVNVVCSGWVDPQDIINRGAAVVALIDKIQSEGQRVELIAFCHIEGSCNERYLMSVTVKRPEEPIDMDRVAFALAHPSMLRRCFFRVVEWLCPYRLSGYGRCAHYDDVLKASNLNLRSIGTDNVTYGDRDQAIAKVQELWNEAAA